MDILIKQCTVIDPQSTYHNSIVDILIKNNTVIKIDKNIEAIAGATIIAAPDLHIAPGFLDIGAHFNEPGLEHKEDLLTGSEAAMAGGFTGVAIIPNTKPVIDNKSIIDAIISKTNTNLVSVYPMGAISQQLKGEVITEMLDMNLSGVIAFTEGANTLQNAGLLLRALQYVIPFNGVIMQQALDPQIAENSMIHESEISAQLGLKGIPSIAESIMVQRDISICEYAKSRLHFYNINQPASLDLVKKAKQNKINITAGACSYNLFFDEKNLLSFDSNFKVMPPLVSTAAIDNLKQAIIDNTIDVIYSNHRPQNIENKNIEFDYAQFGAINLQTSFALANTALKNEISITQLIDKMAVKPRQILQLNIPTVSENSEANFTLFQVNVPFVMKKNYSKSKNFPPLPKQLIGNIVAVINNNKIHIN